MKHFIIISLIGAAAVGAWALLSLCSVELGATVDRPALERKQADMGESSARRSVSSPSQAADKTSRVPTEAISGVGAMAAHLPPMPTPRMAVTPGKAGGAPVGGSKSHKDAHDDAIAVPSAVYAVDEAPFVGAGYSGGMAREISIPVPEGAKVPAVFFDGEDKPVVQLKALDRIAEEFEQNVADVPAGLTKEEVWDAARALADERYITLFGYQAFNQYHLQAAKEALSEKKAIQAGQEEP